MKTTKKLKLRPSVRDNRRYFLAICDDNKKIQKAILDYIGTLGLAKSAYLFVKKQDKYLVGSCLRESLDLVLASLTLKKIKVEKVSGTLKGLKNE